ncbi:MAG: glycosyltransferase family 4 protein [Candidatus Peribacteraceae bacterium]|nr:glycosyltransferase family 4 protein [Candidatus Peribacteraceae bacterium]
MKLLIITQKVDKKDPILGFFHRWIEEFSINCEELHVIGQKIGDYNFPSNVYVYSLGKESGSSKIIQLFKYWKLQWKLRRQYDAVFVHMTPIWVVLGFPIMPLLRKRFFLWYEARGKRWPLHFSLLLPSLKKVFSASTSGMPIKTKKSVIVGHGIDTEQFSFGDIESNNQFVTVGRITRSKRLEMIISAFALSSSNKSLFIVGNTITNDDEKYLKELEEIITNNDLKNRVIIKSLTQQELLPVLKNAKLFLHASETSLDKAVLEAMSCGCLVISSAEAVKPLLPDFCRADDASSMSQAISFVLGLSNEEYEEEAKELRELVVEKHSLPRLMQRLIKEMG